LGRPRQQTGRSPVDFNFQLIASFRASFQPTFPFVRTYSKRRSVGIRVRISERAEVFQYEVYYGLISGMIWQCGCLCSWDIIRYNLLLCFHILFELGSFLGCSFGLFGCLLGCSLAAFWVALSASLATSGLLFTRLWGCLAQRGFPT